MHEMVLMTKIPTTVNKVFQIFVQLLGVAVQICSTFLNKSFWLMLYLRLFVSGIRFWLGGLAVGRCPPPFMFDGYILYNMYVCLHIPMKSYDMQCNIDAWGLQHRNCVDEGSRHSSGAGALNYHDIKDEEINKQMIANIKHII